MSLDRREEDLDSSCKVDRSAIETLRRDGLKEVFCRIYDRDGTYVNYLPFSAGDFVDTAGTICDYLEKYIDQNPDVGRIDLLASYKSGEKKYLIIVYKV